MIPEKLDILWVESTKFLEMDKSKSIAFSYYSETSTILTLHGWSVKGNDKLPDNPQLFLLKGKESLWNTDSPVYLGNQVLDKDIVKKIIDQIEKTQEKFLIFTPSRVSPTDKILYNIFLTNDDPTSASFTEPTLLALGSTNPSPPRTYA